MKIGLRENIDIYIKVKNTLLKLTNCYFKSHHVECYRLSMEERTVLNDFESKLDLLYIELNKLLESNCLKIMSIYNSYDLNLYINGFIDVIYKIYNNLKEYFCNYYHIDINYMNVNMDTDINTFYTSLVFKKKEYYHKILNREVLKYKDNKWYKYLENNFNTLVDEYIEYYPIIDSNILKKFNYSIIGLLNYYDRNYQEDIKDLKKLRFFRVISMEDLDYLVNYAGLWSYYQVRDTVLKKSFVYNSYKKIRGLFLTKQFDKIDTEASMDELFHYYNKHNCANSRSTI